MLRRRWSVFAIASLLLVLCGWSFAQPALVEVRSDDGLSVKTASPVVEGHGLGFWLPEYCKDVRPGRLGVQAAPGMDAAADSFDWVALGKCGPIRDQAGTGTCWVHAGIGELEARVAINESLTAVAALVEYSEQDVGNFYPLTNWVNGGNGMMVASYLAKYGSAYEADEPWTGNYTGPSYGYGTWDPNNTYIKNIRDWHFLGALHGSAPGNIAAIKAAVTQGPVYTSMSVDTCRTWWASRSGGTDGWGTVTVPGTVTVSDPFYDNDHAVVIVGWDDAKVWDGGGPTTGAWKVRNSWGPAWGFAGYFWIGYGGVGMGYATSYSPIGVAGSYQSYDSTMTVMNYDYGWSGSAWGWTDWPAAQMFNLFTVPALPAPEGGESPSATNELYAIDVCATYANATYTVKIYDTYSGGVLSGQLASKSGTLSDAGIYSIELDTPLVVTAGQTRIAFFDVSYPLISNYYTIPASYPRTNQTGKCYARSDSSSAWADKAALYDIVLRARIRNQAPVETPTPTPTPTPTATPTARPTQAERWEIFE